MHMLSASELRSHGVHYALMCVLFQKDYVSQKGRTTTAPKTYTL
jgi:hypothetical protein